LFDYDNNKDYRLLIAGEDRTIYAYDKTGSTVKGWKFFKTNGTVNNEISWFRVSGKDFLVLADETSVYLLDRTGNIRLSLREPVVKAQGSAMRLTPGSGQSLVCSSPDGTVSRFSLKTFSVDHTFDFFDIDGDGLGEYIYIDKGILYLYDHNRAEMFVKDFSSAQIGGPICFTFSAGDRKIGVFDVEKKLIYLLNKEGKLMEGFPLRGASMFSIGKMSEKGDWNLIVGGTDKFLYNYNLSSEF
jgi:WD40 repeat protein